MLLVSGVVAWDGVADEGSSPSFGGAYQAAATDPSSTPLAEVTWNPRFLQAARALLAEVPGVPPGHARVAT